MLDLMLDKLNQIDDPFEQSLFAMVHLPCLQPFADIKRSSLDAKNSAGRQSRCVRLYSNQRPISNQLTAFHDNIFFQQALPLSTTVLQYATGAKHPTQDTESLERHGRNTRN